MLHYLLGLQAEEAGVLKVKPMLPKALRSNGALYHVESLQWGNYALRIQCVVRELDGYTFYVGCSAREGWKFVTAEDGTVAQHEWEWAGKWGDEQMLLLPHLTSSSIT